MTSGGTTPILSLTLYDGSVTDQAATFSSFRAVQSGSASTSNMYRIDTAIGADRARLTSLEGTRGAILVPAVYISANYYEATVAEITALTTNMTIILKLDTASAGTVTLNISSLGTKTVAKINTAGSVVNITSGELMVGKNYLFRYDGTQWIWVSAIVGDQIYCAGTSGNVVTVGSDNTLSGTLTQSVLISQTINSATLKATVVDADRFGYWDSVSTLLRYTTWSDIKTTLTATFTDLSSVQAITGAKTFGTIGGAVGKLILAGSTSGSTILNASPVAGSTTIVLPATSDTLVGLATADTFTGVKTFGTIGGAVGKLILAGSTSGSTILNASPTAGSTTMVLPSTSDTLIGLATTDTLTNKRITSRVGSTTSHATPSINTDNYDVYALTAQAEAITSMTTNLTGTPTNAQKLIIRIKDNGTARAISWGTSFVAGGASLPTTTVISKILTVGFIYNTDNALNKWMCVASAQEA